MLTVEEYLAWTKTWAPKHDDFVERSIRSGLSTDVAATILWNSCARADYLFRILRQWGGTWRVALHQESLGGLVEWGPKETMLNTAFAVWELFHVVAAHDALRDTAISRHEEARERIVGALMKAYRVASGDTR